MLITENAKSGGVNFLPLTLPIFIDNFFRMVTLVSSYALMSQISDELAGILGIINLYLLMGFTFSESLAQGSTIIISQYLGANKRKEIGDVYVVLIILNLLFGAFLSICFLLFPSILLSSFHFSPTVFNSGSFYLQLVGGGFIIYSFNYVLLNFLNAHGFTKYSMYYSLIINGFTLISFYFIAALPKDFDIDRFTLIGLTNLSTRLLGMFFAVFIVKSLIQEIKFFKKISLKQTKAHFWTFIKISLPNAVEPLSFQFYQFFLLKIIATISVEAIAIRNYLFSLGSLFDTTSLSIARGNQIVLAHYVGAQKTESIDPQLVKGILTSLCSAILSVVLILNFREQFMRFFSKEASIVEIGSGILITMSILTFIRAISLNFLSALKATGDMNYCFKLVNCGMWCVAIPGSFLLTKVLNIGLQGIWIVFIIEEVLRSVFLFKRWKSQKWKSSLIVKGPCI